MKPLRAPISSCQAIYKDKASKFLAYLYPIQKEEEVKSHLEVLKQEHKKARHFCYAYRLGFSGELERSNDDGEPSGSAGLPILNQLHSNELSNACLIVVRYFGGTKLGVSGLIKAYKEAAKEVIQLSKTKTLIPRSTIKIQFPISSLSEVERIIIQSNAQIINSAYSERCNFEIEIDESGADKLVMLLTQVHNLDFVKA